MKIITIEKEFTSRLVAKSALSVEYAIFLPKTYINLPIEGIFSNKCLSSSVSLVLLYPFIVLIRALASNKNY